MASHEKAVRRPLLIGLCTLALVAGTVGLIVLTRVNPHPKSTSQKPAHQAQPSLALPANFTLQQKIGQLLVVGVTSKAMAIDLEKNYQIGGFLIRPSADLFSKDATDAVKRVGELPPLFAVDQEGGMVIRLPGVDFSQDSAVYMGGLPDIQVQQIGHDMGQAMAAIGANVDLAPVVDLDDGQNAAISALGRSFSSNPAVVAGKAQAFALGLRKTGIVPTFKLFPGLGNATGSTNGNTDTGTATSPPLASLERSDLVPYKTVLRSGGLSAVMVGNQIVPGLTGGLPASLSSNTYSLLRGKYGFRQVVFTDELLLAKAIADTQPSAASAVIAAIKAGADMPLIDPNDEQSVDSIITAMADAVQSGQIKQSRIDTSLGRILQLKASIKK